MQVKLLLENWREFVREELEEPITTLRIFDFDETIAHTRSETRVKAPDGSTATLGDQKEFEEYMTQAAAKEGIETFDPVKDLQKLGYQIDLSDFAVVKEPEEITAVTDIMRNFPQNSKTYILTARRGDAIMPIMKYLDEIGIDSNNVRPMASEGTSKGKIIARLLSNKIMPNGKSNVSRIEYYEDSDKNIQDVLNHVCDNKKINSIKPDNFELVIYKVEKFENEYRLKEIRC